MATKNFNEELKKMEAEERLHDASGENGDVHLDDTQRVKVLSPGRLVFKRFIRNKLAIVGTAILAFMFIFCFLGPFLYPYKQTEKFYKTDILENADFAAAKERTEYSNYQVDTTVSVHYTVVNKMNFNIKNMESKDQKQLVVRDPDGVEYCISYIADNIYTLSDCELTRIGSLTSSFIIGKYDNISKSYVPSEGLSADAELVSAVKQAIDSSAKEFSYGGKNYSVESAGGKSFAIVLKSDNTMNYVSTPMSAEFEKALRESVGKESFDFGNETYLITESAAGTYDVDRFAVGNLIYVCSPYAVNVIDGSSAVSNDFVREALISFCTDGTFESDGSKYVVRKDGEDINIYPEGSTVPYGIFTTFSVSRTNGSGALPIEFKNDVRAKIEEMVANGITSATLTTKVEKQAEDGSVELDAAGYIVYADTEVKITRKGDDYTISCNRLKYLIDIYAAPMSKASNEVHLIGTDGDGYDILSRMMYGGRISLIVGFVVVVIETLLGIIMGGISGYFGGWVDTLIMRIVDVFYCIPSMPILIILGAFFDAEQMNPYVRLMWLMAVLGFLGWASVARLVRGQILSLREQEFMLATEVGGLKISRRIFRHLIPNVMPQLIVTATAGLGSVILTESTLSFLGLGVKHPLATWGTMINSVSDYSSMVNYTYIWVPVGLLICLTVIAFNFVGDGLRDAFDPKMKR